MGILDKAAVRAQALATGGGKYFDIACRYIADHPVESVGLALVAGYLVSQLTR